MLIRAFEPSDLPWAEGLIGAVFGGRVQARRGELIDVLGQPGFVAIIDRPNERAGTPDAVPVGIFTYRPDGDAYEITYVEATSQFDGIGSALLDTFLRELKPAHVWVVTTNDNVDALRFYQRRGFRIRDVRIGAVTEARETLKPEIGKFGAYGIEIRDEIELEWTAR